MEKTKVAIVGLGTVGSGVAKLLLDYGDRTGRHAGRTLWLEQVVVRDVTKPHNCELPKGILSDNCAGLPPIPRSWPWPICSARSGPARTIMLALLEAGKDVVTANKALLGRAWAGAV